MDQAVLDQLRDKALLALEDAIQEKRYRTPRPSHAVRFALAYLWSHNGGGDRTPFDNFWKEYVAEQGPWAFGAADHALSALYRALGLKRPDAVSWAMWKKWAEREGTSEGQN